MKEGDVDRLLQGPFSSTANIEDIFYCFRLILGRLPGPKEWDAHACRVGESLRDVVSTYLNSQEFHNRVMMAPPNLETVEYVQLDGFGMLASPDDMAVGKHILAMKDYEPTTSSVFRKHLKPGMRVVDIGANIGFYTLLSASRVGPSGEVLSVEPNPANVKLILESVARNDFSNVRVVQAAAYNTWKPLPLFVDSSNASVGTVDCRVDSATGRTVMALPLSAVIGQQKVDLVKIDVEGAEGLALQGMWDVICRCKPVLFSEFTPEAMPGMSGMAAEEYLRMLTSLGYRVSVLDKRQGPVDCGSNPSLVMRAFESTADAHVDLLFEHPTQ